MISAELERLTHGLSSDSPRISGALLSRRRRIKDKRSTRSLQCIERQIECPESSNGKPSIDPLYELHSGWIPIAQSAARQIDEDGSDGPGKGNEQRACCEEQR